MAEMKWPPRFWIDPCSPKVDCGLGWTSVAWDRPVSSGHKEYLSTTEAEALAEERERKARAEAIEAVGLEISKRFHPVTDKWTWTLLGKALEAAREKEGK